MTVRVEPTLEAMAAVYRESLAGGASSRRFASYVSLGREGRPVHGYNPMTSKPVGATVQRLIELDAERIVFDEAPQLVELLGWTGDARFHITVATPGMWTDPAATAAGHALSNRHPGEVLLWFGTEYDGAAVSAATAIQTVRCCWWAAVGAVEPSLRATAWREGIAAAATGAPGESSDVARAALEILGDDVTAATASAFLFGDAAARILGYTPLGLTGTEGLRHAIHEAHRCLATTELGDVFLETVQPASN